jgi:hypothetical protein
VALEQLVEAELAYRDEFGPLVPPESRKET